MRKISITIIALSIVLSISVLAIAEEGWQSIRYFEEVASFELKLVQYEEPLVFKWGKPGDMSGNNNVLPDWYTLLKASGLWTDMTLEEYRSLFTPSSWPAIKVDESNFETFKKKRAKLPDLIPGMRYTLVYAEAHVRMGGRTFMFLLSAPGKDIQEAKEIIKKRWKRDHRVGHSTDFLKKIDGKWKFHIPDLEIDLLPMLTRIPLSIVTLGDIAEYGKAYFDGDINPINMMPLS